VNISSFGRRNGGPHYLLFFDPNAGQFLETVLVDFVIAVLTDPANSASYTSSLASSVTDYKFENGRRYHSYKEGGMCFSP
jgi:hypothetical protein